MSITYPVAPTTVASKKAAGAAIMNSGSALFPSGAAKVYARADKARAGDNRLAWIAAPVAVVLIGGALYLSTAHHGAPPARTTIAATHSTTAITAPVARPAPAPSQAVIPAKPITAETHAIRTQAHGAAPAAHPATAHRPAVARSTSQAAVEAPATDVSTTPTTVVPATSAPVSAAPTRGDFTLTAPAAATPAAPATATPPAVPAQTSAQPQPQASA